MKFKCGNIALGEGNLWTIGFNKEEEDEEEVTEVEGCIGNGNFILIDCEIADSWCNGGSDEWEGNERLGGFGDEILWLWVVNGGEGEYECNKEESLLILGDDEAWLRMWFKLGEVADDPGDETVLLSEKFVVFDLFSNNFDLFVFVFAVSEDPFGDAVAAVADEGCCCCWERYLFLLLIVGFFIFTGLWAPCNL